MLSEEYLDIFKKVNSKCKMIIKFFERHHASRGNVSLKYDHYQLFDKNKKNITIFYSTIYDDGDDIRDCVIYPVSIIDINTYEEYLEYVEPKKLTVSKSVQIVRRDKDDIKKWDRVEIENLKKDDLFKLANKKMTDFLMIKGFVNFVVVKDPYTENGKITVDYVGTII